MVTVTPVRLGEPCGRFTFGVRSSALGVRRSEGSGQISPMSPISPMRPQRPRLNAERQTPNGERAT